MKDKRGFSLIELLAALVIIGLILLIVIPAASRLLTSQDTKEYKNYVTLVEAGAKTYANELKDALGSSMDKGCAEVTLEELIKQEKVKPFSDEKITCSGKVRLNNNKGKLDVSLNLTCVDDKNKETFKKEDIESVSCVAFVHREEGALGNRIVQNGVGGGSILAVGENQYVKGNLPANYVWYSGNLWRIVYYNNKEIKLVSNDIITVMPRNNNSSIHYKNSIVHNWLENVFLPSLKDRDKYLLDTEWNMNPTGSPSFAPANDGNYIVTSKVGLLNNYESSKMGNYLDKNMTWLIGNPSTNSNKIWTKTGSSSAREKDFSKDYYYSIRPAITMKADVVVVSGDGSYVSPYILEGNSTNIPKDTLINTRYSGEYVKVNGVLYRIVRTTGGLTKIIMVDTLPQRQYASEDIYNFSYSDLYNYLKTEWYEKDLGTDKNLIFENASWCSRILNSTASFPSSPTASCGNDSFTSPVGLPSLGDFYTTNFDEKLNTFWTMDVANSLDSSTKKMHVINQENAVSQGSVLEVTETAYVKPVMYLKSNVIITSGEGTKAKPFILGLK